jgi:hypothetical protein
LEAERLHRPGQAWRTGTGRQGKDGAFKIANLPAGKYELEAWHEKFGTRMATVTVGAKEIQTQDFTFVRENT